MMMTPIISMQLTLAYQDCTNDVTELTSLHNGSPNDCFQRKLQCIMTKDFYRVDFSTTRLLISFEMSFFQCIATNAFF